MLWLRRVLLTRSTRGFSRVLGGLVLLPTAVVIVGGWGTTWAVVPVAVVTLLAVDNQHRLRYRVGRARRARGLRRWGRCHGAEHCRRSGVAPAEIGRVLRQVGLPETTRITDALVRREDGLVSFVAHHRAVEQFIVLTAPRLPAISIDEARDRSGGRRHLAGHVIRSDAPGLIGTMVGPELLAVIEGSALGAVTVAHGRIISRGPVFVDDAALEDCIAGLRHIVRCLPNRQDVQPATPESDILTKLTPEGLVPVDWSAGLPPALRG